jgi:alpha-beta hydrolase superfamily lysophospholipase
MEMLRGMAGILQHTSFPLPLLIMQGTEDRHVDPRTTIDFANGLKGEVTLKTWEGLGHELHNEVERDAVTVIQYMRAWLDARTC